ncbi:MAG: hypothetical protein WCO30_01805 [bacterium]
MTKKNSNVGGKVVLGLAALAAGAAGAYFLYGTKEGAKAKKNVKAWTLKLKGDVIDKMEKMKDVTEGGYNEVIDLVHKKYAGVKNIDPEELNKVVGEMKKHWKNIKKEFKDGQKTK